MLRVLDCKRLPAESVHIGNLFDGELCQRMLRCNLERKSFDVSAAGEMISRPFYRDCVLYFHIF
jgi:hypothetical protein